MRSSAKSEAVVLLHHLRAVAPIRDADGVLDDGDDDFFDLDGDLPSGVVLQQRGLGLGGVRGGDDRASSTTWLLVRM